MSIVWIVVSAIAIAINMRILTTTEHGWEAVINIFFIIIFSAIAIRESVAGW